MPKASLATKDAYEMKGGFQEGWGEVVDAKSGVVQYNASKKTGIQLAPFLGLVISIQKTDEHGKPTGDEPVEEMLKLHGNLTEMRPGKINGRDDNDPEDVDENGTLGSEGNCIFVAQDGIKINKNNKGMIFIKSLEEHGFKPEILGAGYFPDLIGLRAHFKTIVGQKISADGGDPTYLVVDKISQYPYEKKAAAKGKTAPAAKTAAKINGAVGIATVADSNSDDSKARELLTLIATEQSGNTMPVQKLNVIAFQKIAKDKTIEVSDRKKIQELVKNVEWLSEAGAEIGLMVDGGDVTFA